MRALLGEHLPAFGRPLVCCISVCIGCRAALALLRALHARRGHGHPRPVGRDQRCRSQHAARISAELVRQAPFPVTDTARGNTAATGKELLAAAAAGARGRAGRSPSTTSVLPKPCGGPGACRQASNAC